MIRSCSRRAFASTSGPGTVHVTLGEHGISAWGIFPNEERAKGWQPDLINGGEMFGCERITPAGKR